MGIWLYPYFKNCKSLKRVFVLILVAFLWWIAAWSLVIYLYDLLNWKVNLNNQTKILSVIVEEAFKMIAFLLIIWSLKRKLRDLSEFILIGIFVGLGFGFYENLWYLLTTWTSLVLTIFRQVLVSWFGIHWLNWALLGLIYGKWYGSYNKKYLLLFVLPLLLHLFYNLFLIYLGNPQPNLMCWLVALSSVNIVLLYMLFPQIVWWLIGIMILLRWLAMAIWLDFDLAPYGFLLLIVFFLVLTYQMWQKLYRQKCTIFGH